MRPKILWCGDAIASTGFAKGTHGIVDYLRPEFEVHVLALNYHGDPHPWRLAIENEGGGVYSCLPGGDFMGYGRIGALAKELKPDVIVIQNDPWNFPRYLERLKGVDTPVVGYVAVDGKNCAGKMLQGLDRAVFWTEFAREEAVAGGFTGPTGVVPLGVDLGVFQSNREAARERLLAKPLAARGLSPDTFMVGVVGRNQWRKRLDLTVQYFARWVEKFGHQNDACLWIHSAPTKDDDFDLDNLVEYYGLGERNAMVPYIPADLTGLNQSLMIDVYSMFDVLFTTTMGEGFWLPGFEAGACQVPIIGPDWSGIGELFENAALLVPCTATGMHPKQTNTLGGVMDPEGAVNALEHLYKSRLERRKYAAMAFNRATDARFRWENVGAAFRTELEQVMGPRRKADAAWAALMAPKVEEPVAR